VSVAYVNDLGGVDLDFWVARAEGLDAVRDGGRCLLGHGGDAYAPTRDETLSAALLARHGVETFEINGRWGAELKGRDTPWGNGATRIEAALRAIVAARFGDAVEDEEIPPPMQCFWLAFVAAGGEPARYLGHAIFEAADMDATVARARALGLHPGADLRVYRVNDEDAGHIPAQWRNRPLSGEEAAALGWQSGP
jgi:hypothetical protein